MTNRLFLVLAIAFFAVATTSANAAEPAETPHEWETVIALSTDDFEIAETDLSHLAVGDAETIQTESGKTIDLLRTEDGVEIYVDGELLDVPMDGDHESHVVIHKHVEIECESEDDCEETVWMSDDGEVDRDTQHGKGHHEKIIVIKEEAESD